jgi:hypothetical protein
VVDVANLLQTDDLFGLGPFEEMTPVPDLDELLHLPECSRGKPPMCKECQQAAEQGPSARGDRKPFAAGLVPPISAPALVEGTKMTREPAPVDRAGTPAEPNQLGDAPE